MTHIDLLRCCVGWGWNLKVRKRDEQERDRIGTPLGRRRILVVRGGKERKNEGGQRFYAPQAGER